MLQQLPAVSVDKIHIKHKTDSIRILVEKIHTYATHSLALFYNAMQVKKYKINKNYFYNIDTQ